MRGVHSAVDDIRRSVFTEVARLAYESDDYKQVDMIPYKIVPGEVAHHRHDVFLSGAISARIKLALGMDLTPTAPLPHQRQHPGCRHGSEIFQRAPGQYHSLCLQRLPSQAGPHHGQLPGLHLPIPA